MKKLLPLLLVLATPLPAAAAVCDTSGVGFYELAAALDAIDADCPCTVGQKTGARAKCAKPIVATRIENGQLDATCKNDALAHVKKSICNRPPGAVVCCRVRTSGKTSHKIARDASKCASTPKIAACTSTFPSVPRGCDASGCISPTCGNGTLEPGEVCDPPNPGVCTPTCQLEVCDPPVTSCGNGTLEPGESCEPPGLATCDWSCAVAPCAAPDPGEIAVACAANGATAGVGASGSDYLLAWADTTYRAQADIVARRLDADGAPLDTAARVVSAGVTCGGTEQRPAIAHDGTGYMVTWSGSGPALDFPGLYYGAIYARAYDADATLGSLVELARRIPFGMCSSSVSGPTTIAPLPLAGPHAFASLWLENGACVGGPQFRDPAGVVLDGATHDPLSIGYGPPHLPPGAASQSAAGVGSLAGDTLAAWNAVAVYEPQPPFTTVPFVAAAWIDGTGSSVPFMLSSRQPGIGPLLHPAVAPAGDRLLVAWAQGPVDVAGEIRGLRVSPSAGTLDPDGGLLLATTAGGAVRGGPVAAYDGTHWQVVWSEVGTNGNDLRAVAVDLDGTILDVTPRLLASGLSDAEPAIASTGDARSLVVYVEPDAGRSAVRARLID